MDEAIKSMVGAAVLRELRMWLGMTQADVAEVAGVDRTLINSVENGRNLATSYRIREGLAKALGLTIEDVAGALAGSLGVAVLRRRTKAKKREPRPRGRAAWKKVAPS
jgi:DNA-binding XRE family transcriptional regulator